MNHLSFKRLKWLIFTLIVIIVIFGVLLYMTQVKKEDYDDFLKGPEQRISVTLPYSKDEEAIGMIPVGETVYHPVAGHPGIDFGWVHKAAIRASADGVITDMFDAGKGNGEMGIVLKSGQYYIEYGSMGEFYPNVRVGVSVKKGDIIGYPNVKQDGQDYAIHWEIEPAYPNSERLCPMSYFDNDSKERIEKLWAATTWEYKTQFPDICNGKWKNLNSFQDILKWNRSPEKAKQDKDLNQYKQENTE